MKQLLQDLHSGATTLAEVAPPRAGSGQVLIRTTRSLVSAGTERMLVDFGKANLIGKALQQPDKVRQVIEKARTDGVLATLAAVRNKLDQPLPLGYSNVGTVIGIGPQVSGFSLGDRVASNGKHAEIVAVPANLCARIPDNVPDESAAFTVLGAIALQGLRLAQPTLGERFAVIGLGLIGLLAVQLLRAHGCRVLAIDLNKERLELAEGFGAQAVDLSTNADPVAAAEEFTSGRGIDGVIIAAATSSSDPVRKAARVSRKRGRIVLVGVTGLELSRADFYEKELSFQVSCSYGPGRYDPAYEDKGQDYPLAYVRWTEQRNFQAVLDMMADGRLDAAPLVSHRFPLAEAERAYALISGDAPHLGVLFEYAGSAEASAPAAAPVVRKAAAGPAVVGVIGAGGYASATLLPALAAAGARLRAIASASGVTGAHQGKKHGFESVASGADAVLADAEVNAVVIATRHDSHASLAARALVSGRHVFVEKPLGLTPGEIDEVRDALARAPGAPVLMVGFNRRFAPQVRAMKETLAAAAEPMSIVITVNAGAVPASHWTQDPAVGGGRIAGEACHFVDLARHLAGSPIASVAALPLREKRHGPAFADKATITLGFESGSFAAIHYLANGHKSFPKERVEVFRGGRVLQLDNFLRLRGWGWPGLRASRLWRQDKGNAACVAAFVRAVEAGGPAPIPVEEIFEVSRATLEAAEALRC
ncbi:MAG: bi-domain-containing oxidoreductase [Betaproteobacteria bacterium]|nr:bi-domain-containing oxidoreductase [Betaproteobacteria bacterium]